MVLVFSDLDGTLLDHDTYDYTPAREGLAFLKNNAVPLILVSSKTMPEMKIVHEEMGLDAPYIFENGGGIYWPDNNEHIEHLGMDISELKSRREAIDAELKEPVYFITDMTVEEIVNRTGLSREKALLAQRRLTSLPFILPSGRNIGQEEMRKINAVLQAKGLSMTKGGRFYHFLSLQSDKGSAIKRVIDYYRKTGAAAVTTIGIGDSENDIPMFMAVDIPVVIRKKDGTVIETGMDHVRITTGIGPDGFSEAVMEYATNLLK
jgi:mannosyl-3-phosphoglycerate phosphatase